MENLIWRKSTRSTAQGECVEVADNRPDVVLVRDSKDPGGPVLVFRVSAWRRFVDSMKTDVA